MEFFDTIALTDLEGSAELSKMIDKQLQTQEEEEDDGIDVGFLEKIIFANHERSYSQLNSRVTKQVVKAFSKVENAIECENCKETFMDEQFQMHACQYNELQQLNTVPGNEETELQQLQRRTIDLMKENVANIREITKDSTNVCSTIECSLCCRKFVHENGLYRHWEMHFGELLAESRIEDPKITKNFALCVFCGEVFICEIDAWDHLVSHHVLIDEKECLPLDTNNNNQNESPVANETESDSQKSGKFQISGFVRMVTLCKVFQCEFCDSIFSNAKSALFHASQHDPSGFCCYTCEVRVISLKDILLHRRDECVIRRDVRSPLLDFSIVFICNVCNEEFRGLEQLSEHRHSINHFFPRKDPRSNELMFECERCLDIFSFAPQLIDHFHEKHKKKPKTNEIAETSERIPKPSSSRRGGSHQTSTRPRQYLCEVCGKSYTQSSHLWQHLRFHQGVKPFACTVENCDRKFTIRPDLNDHIRKCHTGERPFLCTICGKRFLTGSVYYQHRLIHRGERRYGCEECGKRFYRADALKNHLRIHSGEKPHNCAECGKNFRQRGDRDKHMKARHPDAKAANSPKKKRVKSFGRGRVKNNTSLYRSMPEKGLND